VRSSVQHKIISSLLLLVWTFSVVSPRLFLHHCQRTGQQSLSLNQAAHELCGSTEEKEAKACCHAPVKKHVKASCSSTDLQRAACSCCHVKALEWDTDATQIPSSLAVPLFAALAAPLFALLHAFDAPRVEMNWLAVAHPPPLPVLSLLHFGCQRC